MATIIRRTLLFICVYNANQEETKDREYRYTIHAALRQRHPASRPWRRCQQVKKNAVALFGVKNFSPFLFDSIVRSTIYLCLRSTL